MGGSRGGSKRAARGESSQAAREDTGACSESTGRTGREAHLRQRLGNSGLTRMLHCANVVCGTPPLYSEHVQVKGEQPLAVAPGLWHQHFGKFFIPVSLLTARANSDEVTLRKEIAHIVQVPQETEGKGKGGGEGQPRLGAHTWENLYSVHVVGSQAGRIEDLRADSPSPRRVV